MDLICYYGSQRGKNFKAKDFFEFLSRLFFRMERFSDTWKFFLIIASDLHTLSENQGLNSFQTRYHNKFAIFAVIFEDQKSNMERFGKLYNFQ